MRYESVNPDAINLFLETLSLTANRSKAAREAGLRIYDVYRWVKESPEFARRYEEALALGIDTLEDEAFSRAIEGVEKPIYFQGVRVDTVKEVSDTLAMFMLKAHKPDVYTPKNSLDISDKSTLSDEQRVQKIEQLLKLAAQRRELIGGDDDGGGAANN